MQDQDYRRQFFLFLFELHIPSLIFLFALLGTSDYTNSREIWSLCLHHSLLLKKHERPTINPNPHHSLSLKEHASLYLDPSLAGVYWLSADGVLRGHFLSSPFSLISSAVEQTRSENFAKRRHFVLKIK